MPRINQKEYDRLKELDDKWEWIARDLNRSHLSYGYLFAYANKPSKSPLAEDWKTSDGVWLVLVDNDLFQFIKWEDEEPHNIAELIKEYEKDYKGSWEHAIEFSKEMRRESEETEVNKMDKEKLLDLLDRQTFAYHEMQPESPEDYTAEYKKGYNEGLKFAITYIDQLDEPELPVIPQFVAKYLDFAKSDTTLMRVMELANTRNEWPKWEKEYDWISANDETFARAWLDGFLIEDDIEVWQPITGFYNEVSNLGRVRSVKHKAGNGKIYKSKILKPVVTNSGYVNVAIINKNQGKITKRLHRLVAEAFIPNPENKPEINHIDGNKENNEVSNLEWVTSKENKRHAWENDLQVSVKGSEKPLAKLKEEDIVSIRKEYREGCIQMELAEKYGVARQTISSIVNMKAWKHVAEEVSE